MHTLQMNLSFINKGVQMPVNGFTFGLSDDMAKAKPFAQMMKSLVAWV